MFMTQQSQRLWGHATVVAQARPPSHMYVHQYQRITLEEVVASSLAAPSLLSPHRVYLFQTVVLSAEPGGGRWGGGY